MPRGLDHIVHAVRDLDAAAVRYRELGFTVGQRNRHPWGTHNHIIQFPGFFIELITLAEPDKLSDDIFSANFGIYNRDFTARHEALSMLVLESTDSAGDVAAFETAGIAASGSTRFDREGKRPDGTAVHVAFSLAFAKDKTAPEIGFFTCQQHYPENFWNPAFQKHDNGVTGIAAVVIVADEPARHRDFLTAFTGALNVTAEGEGYRLGLPRGAIEVMTPDAYAVRYGLDSPDTAGGPRLAAMRFVGTLPRSPVTALGAGLIFGR
ncbi:VOC family protein [Undibacter mobilis]|uniref:VOC family protein n=1 Tax=Undibacter mobilis TaxID=2292256 RepID=A0A371B0Z2_9BRAD|nr:VOC family protein [Undibacter mobilis]RDV01210.1 VOC family protein [Undibacter mobilis]